MVKDHHLQLRCHHLLFSHFKWLNIKPAKAHKLVIQREMDELLAKGATEVLAGGTGFLLRCVCGS